MTDPQQQIPLAPPPTAASGGQQNPHAPPPAAAPGGQQADGQRQQAINEAVSTLFPAFDSYVRRQTVLNEAQIAAINENKAHHERCFIDSLEKKIRI